MIQGPGGSSLRFYKGQDHAFQRRVIYPDQRLRLTAMAQERDPIYVRFTKFRKSRAGHQRRINAEHQTSVVFRRTETGIQSP